MFRLSSKSQLYGLLYSYFLKTSPPATHRKINKINKIFFEFFTISFFFRTKFFPNTIFLKNEILFYKNKVKFRIQSRLLKQQLFIYIYISYPRVKSNGNIWINLLRPNIAKSAPTPHKSSAYVHCTPLPPPFADLRQLVPLTPNQKSLQKI